jgi:pyrroline-5-carboxylate reductase
MTHSFRDRSDSLTLGGMTYEMGIIGAGQMAEAIVRGLLQSGLYAPQQLIAADVAEPRRLLFSEQLKIKVASDNAEAARSAGILLLSVKPYQLRDVLPAIGAVLSPDTLMISIAAGVRSGSIETFLGQSKPWRIVRAMPNTPMLVGEGMVAIAPGAHATQDDLATARKIFAASADVIDVTEDQIDAVTAVSGSGPAYFFYFVEQMIDAGIEMGLSAEQAHRLASKTALGAAKMLLTSADSPQELRRKVTTPNGTTHAAISHMEGAGMGETIRQAMKAAQRRSKELGA